MAPGDFYPSARDGWLTAVVTASMALAALSTLTAYVAAPGAATTLGIVVLLAVIAFVIWVWVGTGYRTDEREMVVRSGPFRWRVPLDAITSVQPTRNPLSSPALSLHRLEVRYGRRIIMISPRERTEFLRHLQRRCPQARIEG